MQHDFFLHYNQTAVNQCEIGIIDKIAHIKQKSTPTIDTIMLSVIHHCTKTQCQAMSHFN